MAVSGSARGLMVQAGNQVVYRCPTHEEETAKTLARMALAPYLIPVWGVWNMIARPYDCRIAGISFRITPLPSGLVSAVSAEAVQRLNVLHAAGIHFDAFLRADELLDPQPLPVASPTRFKDPYLFGLFLIGPNRVLACLVGKWEH